MYTALISILIGALAGTGWTLLDLWKGWAMGIVLGTVLAATAFLIITRVLSKRVEPLFAQVQKQIQAGATQAAVNSLEDLMPMTRWQILLKGQIHAQIGSLQYSLGNNDKALEHLKKSSRRVADAQLFLAALHFRKKDFDEAKKVMNDAIAFNKKQVMLYNVLAWMMLKQGNKEEALEVLIKGAKADDKSEATKDNLLRVQNGKKINMKRFGMSWYALQLEKPPNSMRQAPPGGGRPGFRQKRRGGRR